ncbi:proteasome assembly chaperone 4 [Tripterygium wilfordii]|uniref:Proteasome assembly chaperone 4 n=1 Tax=Tripterygium wilfordii TaxID=458696 RepID=A0A7J7E0Q1_TRIWF|nr:uncharacterized protein LOC120000648 [Tripterygium wilfordii]XP_038704711.1 uncharacterized protein LOC120000648 [Tripterygium wilfordii]KAF5752101.1 proteasome assembly chaperone 4 [Tripterygium wilfordii]
MARENSNFDEEDNLRQALNSFQSITFEEEDKSSSSTTAAATKLDDASDVLVTSFTDVVDNFTLCFQIIRLPQQIYAWIGCNSSKFGHLYAAAPTRPSNTVSVATLIKGSCDDPVKSIARRLVLKTGLPVTVASNIPKNSPMLEINAEKKLVEKLISLGYTKRKLDGLSS